jgi:hypothetical protein
VRTPPSHRWRIDAVAVLGDWLLLLLLVHRGAGIKRGMDQVSRVEGGCVPDVRNIMHELSATVTARWRRTCRVSKFHVLFRMWLQARK